MKLWQSVPAPAHLNEALLLPPAQLREGVDDDAGEVHLDGVVLQRVADHRGVVVHVPTVQYSTVRYSTVQYSSQRTAAARGSSHPSSQTSGWKRSIPTPPALSISPD